MSSEKNCLYCQEKIYPGLDFQNRCGIEVGNLGRKATSGVPIRAKGVKQVVGTREVIYRHWNQYLKRYTGQFTKTVKVRERKSESVNRGILTNLKIKSLKGPLCYDCMMRFLEQIVDVFQGVKTQGKKKALETSMEKIRKKFLNLVNDWEKNFG